MTNPRPDRRSKRRANQLEWRAGARVYVRPGEGGAYGEVRFLDGSSLFYGGRGGYDQPGDVIVPHLEKAPPALGQILREPTTNADYAFVLAMAVEKGLLTLGQVRGLAALCDTMPDEVYDAFRHKHWLQ